MRILRGEGLGLSLLRIIIFRCWIEKGQPQQIDSGNASNLTGDKAEVQDVMSREGRMCYNIMYCLFSYLSLSSTLL